MRHFIFLTPQHFYFRVNGCFRNASGPMFRFRFPFSALFLALVLYGQGPARVNGPAGVPGQRALPGRYYQGGSTTPRGSTSGKYLSSTGSTAGVPLVVPRAAGVPLGAPLGAPLGVPRTAGVPRSTLLRGAQQGPVPQGAPQSAPLRGAPASSAGCAAPRPRERRGQRVLCGAPWSTRLGVPRCAQVVPRPGRCPRCPPWSTRW